MFRTDVFRTASFRLAAGGCVILAGASLLQFGLIGWQTARFENARVNRLIEAELARLVRAPPPDLVGRVDRHFSESLRTLPVAGLFASGRRVEGDIASYPAGLAADGRARPVVVTLSDGRQVVIRAAAHVLGGGVLLIGRDDSDLVDLRRITRRSLLLSFVPALLISLAGGAWLGYRALVRVGDMHRSIERIMAGRLQERLPTRDADGDIERLAGSVNGMLDRIERLLAEVRGVADDIAHDLRTPLARVRATLERTRERARDADELRTGIDRAVSDLDRAFAIITALLRIAEIEGLARRAGFARADLAEIAADAIELYEPVAEARLIALSLRVEERAVVEGDQDLLMEAVANLLDNSVKFTQAGGHVVVTVGRRETRPFLEVADDGIGLAPSETDMVLRRFYRADRSRHVPGSGLGLSLVAAIAGLHGAEVIVTPLDRGVRFGLAFEPAPEERDAS